MSLNILCRLQFRRGVRTPRAEESGHPVDTASSLVCTSTIPEHFVVAEKSQGGEGPMGRGGLKKDEHPTKPPISSRVSRQLRVVVMPLSGSYILHTWLW